MRLTEKQFVFAREIAGLIIWANQHGMRVTLGDAYRDPRVFGLVGDRRGYGNRNSLHKQRLALDLNLFLKNVDGEWEYCHSTASHRELGEEWVRRGGAWGGEWGWDGNHYQWAEGLHR